MDYQKLTTDLRQAAEAAREAAANSDDGGTCNMDCVFMALPRVTEVKVLEAFKAAGVAGAKRKWLGSTGYMIMPPGAGQANSRCASMGAMKQTLAEFGYDVCGYYQMD